MSVISYAKQVMIWKRLGLNDNIYTVMARSFKRQECKKKKKKKRRCNIHQACHPYLLPRIKSNENELAPYSLRRLSLGGEHPNMLFAVVTRRNGCAGANQTGRGVMTHHTPFPTPAPKA